MKGQEVIIKMRSVYKVKPELVYINDYPCLTGIVYGQTPWVVVSVYGDAIETLDFRFLVGLDVRIDGETNDRAKSLFEAAVGAGASYVASCHVAANRYVTDSFLKVWSKEDGVIYG